MSLRVSQQMIYQDSLMRMNSSLSQMMESNLQASSQKKVNRPSDDPVGMTRILNYRNNLGALDQFQTNNDMAKGWLNLADSTMVQVNTVITRLKELAEQGSTGTITADNRQQIAAEARQLFKQLVAMANTKFDGKAIFGGQKTNISPFTETLTLSSNQQGVVSNAGFSIHGFSEYTTLVQFPSNSGMLSASSTFRYSSDGGSTWTTGKVSDPGAPNRLQLNLGGVSLELDRNTTIKATSASNTNDTTGTWLWVRPTAQYTGDDMDSITVDPLRGMGSTVTGTAKGVFSDNVIVRIDSTGTLGSDISYSYSMDGGSTWKVSNTSTPDALDSSANLNLPGGVLSLHSNAGNSLVAGSMFVVHPRQALINFDISFTERIAVNGVGKDIFGGIYQDPASNAARPVVIAGYSNVTNLFETVGKLVGYLETNTQSGVQQALADLRSSSQTVLNYAADVGARENRLDVAEGVGKNLFENQTQQLSNAEDVDLSALMVRMAQQQLAYQTVLKSSSMIMNLSLMNYL